MTKKGIFLILVSFFVFASLVAFVYYDNLNKTNFPLPAIQPTQTENSDEPQVAESTPQETETPTQQQEPETQQATSSAIPAGWLTYTSVEYGFQISHPPTYEALDDADNLYGWPNGVVLFYKGGQSYDLPVEAWTSEREYEAKYPATMMDLVTVHQVGTYYITLFNQNEVSEVDNIISTFTLLN